MNRTGRGGKKFQSGFDPRRHIGTITPEMQSKSAEARRAKRAAGLKTRSAVRRFLIRTRGYKCQECGLSEWRGEKLPLEVEHINGKKHDHRDENVMLLCPNCHSLTPTWRGKKRA